MGALRVPVFVEHWQIECCGTPPGVGDAVEWVLVFAADPPGTPADAAGVTLDALASPCPVSGRDGAESGGRRIDPNELPTRLDAGNLHAFWPVPRVARGPVRVSGRLTEEHHGGAPEWFPRTVGTVARVQVVTEEYVLSATEKRRYVPAGTPPEYRDVRRSPAGFSHVSESADRYRAERGVLVDLVVSAAAGGGAGGG